MATQKKKKKEKEKREIQTIMLDGVKKGRWRAIDPPEAGERFARRVAIRWTWCLVWRDGMIRRTPARLTQ